MLLFTMQQRRPEVLASVQSLQGPWRWRQEGRPRAAAPLVVASLVVQARSLPGLSSAWLPAAMAAGSCREWHLAGGVGWGPPTRACMGPVNWTPACMAVLQTHQNPEEAACLREDGSCRKPGAARVCTQGAMEGAYPP